MQAQEKKYEFGPRGQAAAGQASVQREQGRSVPAHAAAPPARGSSEGPLKSYRSGALQVAIWENEGLSPEGQVQTYKTVSFERRYKDKTTGEWKSSNSLRVNDLPKATLLLQKAYEYLILTGDDNDESYQHSY